MTNLNQNTYSRKLDLLSIFNIWYTHILKNEDDVDRNYSVDTYWSDDSEDLLYNKYKHNMVFFMERMLTDIDFVEIIVNVFKLYDITLNNVTFYSPNEYNYKTDTIIVSVEMEKDIYNKPLVLNGDMREYVQYYIDNIRVGSRDGYISVEPSVVSDVVRDDYVYMYAIGKVIYNTYGDRFRALMDTIYEHMLYIRSICMCYCEDAKTDILLSNDELLSSDYDKEYVVSILKDCSTINDFNEDGDIITYIDIFDVKTMSDGILVEVEVHGHRIDDDYITMLIMSSLSTFCKTVNLPSNLSIR